VPSLPGNLLIAVRRRQRSGASRRGGYVVSIAINGVLLYLLNVHPGWQSMSFLTPATAQVIGLVNLTLWAGIAANGVYVISDPPPLRALGDLVTLTIALVTTVRVWDVFPFAFHGSVAFVAVIARVVLIIGIVGASIGILYSVVTLIRSLVRAGPQRG
jgi:hypothetical protein